MDSSKFDLCEFFSVCLQVTTHAGKFIKDISDAGNLNTKFKGVDDPVTDADFKVQTLTVKALRNIWPEIRIVGEESVDYKGELGVDYTNLRRDIVTKEYFSEAQSTTLDLSKVCVWIDPLDGTTDFVKGVLYGVTTLIGVTYEGKSIAGLIGKYFDDAGEKKYNYNPRTYFGYVDAPHVWISDLNDDYKITELIPPKPEENRFYVATTSSHFNDITQRFMDELKPDKVCRISGLGNKIMECILGSVDGYCYPQDGASRWDICPGEALIKALGGNLTDTNGNTFVYDADAKSFRCVDGVVASLRERPMKKMLDCLSTLSKSKL